jgi:methionyl-tRNA synthetase
MEKANISFDDWIRTTQPRHKAAVEEIWKRCVASGSIYKDKHEGWCEALHRRALQYRFLVVTSTRRYCVSDETFVKETDTGFIEKDGQQVPTPPPPPLQNCNTGQIRVNMESRQPVEWVTEENYKYATIPSPTPCTIVTSPACFACPPFAILCSNG